MALCVAVALADGEDDAVGVGECDAGGESVRDGEGVGVAVAGARSTKAKSPNVETYPQSVPCWPDRLSNVKPESGDQVDPLLRSRTSRWGSEYGGISKTTHRILLPD